MPYVGASASLGVSAGVPPVFAGGTSHDKPGLMKLTSLVTLAVMPGLTSSSVPLTWPMFVSSVGPHPTPGSRHVSGPLNTTISVSSGTDYVPTLDGNVAPNIVP